MAKIGSKSGFPGNMQPSTGNIELRGQTSGIDILTLTQGSSGGRALVMRANTTALSTVGTSDIAWFSSVGAFMGGLPALDVTSTAITGWCTGGGSAVALGTTGYQTYFVHAMSSGATVTLPTLSAGGRVIVAEGNNTSGIDFVPSATGLLIMGGSLSGDLLTCGTTGGNVGQGHEFFTDGTYWYGYTFFIAPKSTIGISTMSELAASS